MDLAETYLSDASPYHLTEAIAPQAARSTVAKAHPPVPDYLSRHYWWAYIDPKAVAFFERRWLVNLILLGNYDRLARAAVNKIDVGAGTKVLQIACAYGALSPMLAQKTDAANARLQVVDVLPIQLSNLSKKLGAKSTIQLSCMDSCKLEFDEDAFDSVLLFFLMHEQPDDVRRRTLKEAYRVLKEGGKLILVDYSLPSKWNPFRYFIRMVLRKLEPFALDLWVNDTGSWLPEQLHEKVAARRTFFAGMYQMLEIVKR